VIYHSFEPQDGTQDRTVLTLLDGTGSKITWNWQYRTTRPTAILYFIPLPVSCFHSTTCDIHSRTLQLPMPLRPHQRQLETRAMTIPCINSFTTTLVWKHRLHNIFHHFIIQPYYTCTSSQNTPFFYSQHTNTLHKNHGYQYVQCKPRQIWLLFLWLLSGASLTDTIKCSQPTKP